MIIYSILFLEKYYLVDASYTHIRGFMTLYHNIRNWLSDCRGDGKVAGKRGGINLYTCKIKEAFDVVKVHFQYRRE